MSIIDPNDAGPSRAWRDVVMAEAGLHVHMARVVALDCYVAFYLGFD